MAGKDEQRRSHLKVTPENCNSQPGPPEQHVAATKQLTPRSRWPLAVVVPFSPSQQGCCVPSITGPSPASPHHRPGIDDFTLLSSRSEPTPGLGRAALLSTRRTGWASCSSPAPSTLPIVLPPEREPLQCQGGQGGNRCTNTSALLQTWHRCCKSGTRWFRRPVVSSS